MFLESVLQSETEEGTTGTNVPCAKLKKKNPGMIDLIIIVSIYDIETINLEVYDD